MTGGVAMNVIVNLAGFVLLGLIVWWFWGAKPRAQRVTSEVVEVLVDAGVYEPARIEAVAGRPLRLRFLRRDASPCAEQVIFDTLGVSATLPLGTPVELTVTPPAAGEYPFTCQMQMYRGVLLVR